MNGEIAGLERRSGHLVRDHARVLVEASQYIIERCKFSLADHRVCFSFGRRKDTVKLDLVTTRILKIWLLRTISLKYIYIPRQILPGVITPKVRA